MSKATGCLGFLETNSEQGFSLKKHNGTTTNDEQNDSDEPRIHEEYDDTDEPTIYEYDGTNEIDEPYRTNILQVDGYASFLSDSLDNSQQKIPVNTTNRAHTGTRNKQYVSQNLHTIQRSN